MTILSPNQKEHLRALYLKRVHNVSTSVRKIVSSEVVQPNPHYKGKTEDTFGLYTGFLCSIYNLLSGKTNRLLGELGVAELTKELGVMEDEVRIVQYISDQTLIDNVLDDITNNLVLNEEVLIEAEWWLVRKVVADSEGVQHTVLLTK